MQTVTDFPHPVEIVEADLWIPLRCGERLAARIWRPRDAAERPVPALLEYLPYRKRDMTRARDEPMHHYFAGHGYASLRVDLRGSGDSTGTMHDEYALQEQDDAVEVIAWIAAQSWCTGDVGMFGISWGGFNALQVAARQPPALKAILTSCSTDDRYADDMHYMGGCLLNDNLDWGTTFFSLLPLPPDPEIAGPGWRESWMERLEAVRCPVEEWMRHPTRDAYWKHGSVNEDYGAIVCPVFAVGGWLDGYSNAILRLLANLQVPRLGLIGPHAHQFGHSERAPGPAIGFLQEARRWWDHWLKGEDTSIMREPMLRAFMGDDIPAEPWYPECPGRWVAEATWPSPGLEEHLLHLGVDGLSEAPGDQGSLSHGSPQTVGLAAGEWCPYGTGGTGPEFPGDQRRDDARSLTFDSAPLPDRLEILGAPVLHLELTVDRPRAFVAVRLNDVKPDGSATRVTFGLLNLCHRDGHETPALLEPGRRYTVAMQLNDAAYAFAAGHRLRVSLSTTYWPMVWPSPEAATLTVFTGASRLSLPVRPHRGDEPVVGPLGRPEEGPPMPQTQIRAGVEENTVTEDLLGRRVEVRAERGGGVFRIDEHGLEFGRNTSERLAITEADPLSAESEMRVACHVGRDDWQVRIEARTRLTAGAECFHLQADLDVYENGERIFCRSWPSQISRSFS